eukprot:5991031-Lingulodinium_polyedra.AAC.1
MSGNPSPCSQTKDKECLPASAATYGSFCQAFAGKNPRCNRDGVAAHAAEFRNQLDGFARDTGRVSGKVMAEVRCGGLCRQRFSASQWQLTNSFKRVLACAVQASGGLQLA